MYEMAYTVIITKLYICFIPYVIEESATNYYIIYMLYTLIII